MSRSAEQKIRLLVLYDILHKETDAEHHFQKMSWEECCESSSILRSRL